MHHLPCQKAYIPRCLAGACLLEFLAGGGELGPALFGDCPQGVQLAAGRGRFPLAALGLGPGFQEFGFQFGDPRLGRPGACLLPGKTGIKVQDRWRGGGPRDDFAYRHAAGLADVPECSQPKMNCPDGGS